MCDMYVLKCFLAMTLTENVSFNLDSQIIVPKNDKWGKWFGIIVYYIGFFALSSNYKFSALVSYL